MDKYGLIGYPLGHSFSITYHNQRFADEGINAKYFNYEIPSIDNLTEVLDSNPELKGLNVTIPYKQKVMEYLDYISPEARAIGAVNVIRVIHEGKNTILKGYNSDVIGFTQSIEPMLEEYHKKALILGTGGASKAINYGLKSLGLETIFVSRYRRPGTICYEDITRTVWRCCCCRPSPRGSFGTAKRSNHQLSTWNYRLPISNSQDSADVCCRYLLCCL